VCRSGGGRERPGLVVAQGPVVEQHACHDQWPCQAAAAGLVRARDEARAELAVEPQQLLAGAERHGREDSSLLGWLCDRFRGFLLGNLARSGFGFWRRRGACAAGAVLAELPNACLAADLAAQVVELRPVHISDRDDVDLLDLWRMQRKRPLDADAEGLLAHREGLAGAGPLALEDDALEDLDPRSLSLDHLEVDADRVTSFEPGDVRPHLGALD